MKNTNNTKNGHHDWEQTGKNLNPSNRHVFLENLVENKKKKTRIWKGEIYLQNSFSWVSETTARGTERNV